jgi:hypothetical protein
LFLKITDTRKQEEIHCHHPIVRSSKLELHGIVCTKSTGRELQSKEVKQRRSSLKD